MNEQDSQRYELTGDYHVIVEERFSPVRGAWSGSGRVLYSLNCGPGDAGYHRAMRTVAAYPTVFNYEGRGGKRVVRISKDGRDVPIPRGVMAPPRVDPRRIAGRYPW